MAAGLMRRIAATNLHVTSAGTHAKTAVNDLSVQALAEVAVDISDHRPATNIQRCDTDEPALRGIDGIDRMRIIRDDIAARVRALATVLA